GARGGRAERTRLREHEVGEQGKYEARGEQGEAANDPRPAFPPDPERREPDEAGDDCEAAGPRATREAEEEAGRDERESRGRGQRGGRLRGSGIRREPAGPAGDGERGDRVGDGERCRGEAHHR